jgi:Ca2+-binding RTX toxin-like protein
MLLQYNLDHGAQATFQDFVHAQHYTDAFETALQSKAQDLVLSGKGLLNNVDLQNLDTYGEVFNPKGQFDGAYVSTYAAVDFDAGASLDKAQYILFKGDIGNEGGVDLELAGKTSHVIGLTQEDDTIVIGGKASQIVDGGQGDDIIFSGKGDDKLFGGTGDDEIHAGKGNDFVDGGDGNDKLFGDRGDDSIFGGGGEDTVDGGWGFDVGKVDGLKADFHYSDEEGAWVNDVTGVHVKNTEYVSIDGLTDNVLITVASSGEAEVARLFQAITDQDPSVGAYKDALVAFHNGAQLDKLASDIGKAFNNDDLSSTVAVGDRSDFVKEVVHRLFDGSTGESSFDVDGFLANHQGGWKKAEIVADLVQHVTNADDHIGIHIDTHTV